VWYNVAATETTWRGHLVYSFESDVDAEGATLTIGTDDGYSVTGVEEVGGRVVVRVERAAKALVGKPLSVNGTTIMVNAVRYDRGNLWVQNASNGEWLKA
jgi:hypothetical protein